jgi:hypothetical protein
MDKPPMGLFLWVYKKGLMYVQRKIGFSISSSFASSLSLGVHKLLDGPKPTQTKQIILALVFGYVFDTF